ncbi:hypothetical protein B0H13DRAFT_2361876 [Mycena leptocephala]|nr:hypothetical protein B0H13DRAFT_2361876 [Mycena leptocephala]
MHQQLLYPSTSHHQGSSRSVVHPPVYPSECKALKSMSRRRTHIADASSSRSTSIPRRRMQMYTRRWRCEDTRRMKHIYIPGSRVETDIHARVGVAFATTASPLMDGAYAPRASSAHCARVSTRTGPQPGAATAVPSVDPHPKTPPARARKPTFDAQGYIPIHNRIDLRLPHRQPHLHRAYTTRIDRLVGARTLRSYSPQPTRKQSRDTSSHCVPQFSLPSDIDSAAYMCPSCPRCNPPRAPKHLAIWMSKCTVHSA